MHAENARMIHLWDRQSCKPHLSHSTGFVLYQTAVSILLAHFCRGEPQMIDQPQPIVAMIGGDITLLCLLDPSVNAVSLTVEWARDDLNPRFVHVRREGVELLIYQNPSFIGRTSIDRLRCGDVSLRLSRVKLSDEGTYRCFVPAFGKESVVKLVVGSASSPVMRISKLTGEGGLVLQCESAGWYPEPEVFWLDGEGNLPSDGPTETVRGPDDLFTVSSRVTVEKRHSNSFTCRVHQKNINQTRETHIHVSDDLFVVPSGSVGRLIIVLAVGFLFILAVVLISFKLTRNKTETKMHRVQVEVEVEERGTKESESEQLMMEDEKNSVSSRERRELDEELERYDGELKNVHHEIQTLMEHQEDLKNQKDKLVSLLHSVMTPTDKSPTKKKKKKDGKQDLETCTAEHKELLTNTEKLLKTTKDMINRMTERKEKLEEKKEEINKQLKESQTETVPE